jgi:hypothetical protein
MGDMMRLLRKCGAGEHRDDAKNGQQQRRVERFHISDSLVLESPRSALASNYYTLHKDGYLASLWTEYVRIVKIDNSDR